MFSALIPGSTSGTEGGKWGEVGGKWGKGRKMGEGEAHGHWGDTLAARGVRGHFSQEHQ